MPLARAWRFDVDAGTARMAGCLSVHPPTGSGFDPAGSGSTLDSRLEFGRIYTARTHGTLQHLLWTMAGWTVLDGMLFHRPDRGRLAVCASHPTALDAGFGVRPSLRLDPAFFQHLRRVHGRRDQRSDLVPHQTWDHGTDLGRGGRDGGKSLALHRPVCGPGLGVGPPWALEARAASG